MRKTVKRQKFKSNEGITLIALVITVIVLLILAGVAISMLSGENGILKQAAKAKTEMEKQSTLEQIKLAAIAAMTNPEHKVTASDLSTELGKYEYSLDDTTATDNWTVTKDGITYTITSNGEVDEMAVVNVAPTTAVTIKTKYLDENCENSTNNAVIIPKGFYVKEGLNEIDKGVVVVAPDGSEFVWVPVEDVSKMYGTLSDGTKAGKLYNNGDITSKLNWTEPNGVMSWTDETYRNKEPDTLGCYDSGSGENGGTVTKKGLQKEFDEMIKYVGKNKGFYVGRYETSLDAEGNVQSKGNVQSATAADIETNEWYGLYAKQKTYKNSNVGSSMIWGSQYDQMMIWMTKNGKDVTQAIDGYNKGNNGGSIGTTGTTPTDVINNVYDLYGNGYEWTLEADWDEYRIPRGGCYYFSISPAKRWNDSTPDESGDRYCSRLALYVK